MYFAAGGRGGRAALEEEEARIEVGGGLARLPSPAPPTPLELKPAPPPPPNPDDTGPSEGDGSPTAAAPVDEHAPIARAKRGGVGRKKREATERPGRENEEEEGGRVELCSRARAVHPALICPVYLVSLSLLCWWCCWWRVRCRGRSGNCRSARRSLACRFQPLANRAFGRRSGPLLSAASETARTCMKGQPIRFAFHLASPPAPSQTWSRATPNGQRAPAAGASLPACAASTIHLPPPHPLHWRNYLSDTRNQPSSAVASGSLSRSSRCASRVAGDVAPRERLGRCLCGGWIHVGHRDADR